MTEQLTGFPQPLADYIEIDRDGWATLNYPKLCGAQSAMLRAALDRRRDARAYLKECVKRIETVYRQWDEYRCAREAAKSEGAAAEQVRP